MSNGDDRAMTIKEVAKFLNISNQMVYNLINDGTLQAFKIGSASRIMFSDVQKFIQRQKVDFARQHGPGKPDTSLFTVDRLTIRKEGFLVDNISFSFPRGKIMSILGASGSGKTLLLKAIAGVEEPENGAIFLGKFQLDELPPHQRRIGYVFENYALFPHLNTKGNIDFPLKIWKKSKQIIEAETAKRLEELDIDPAYLKTFPAYLPEGIKQLVAIARGKNHEFDLFIMDEPMSQLDAAHHVQMRMFLQKLVRDMQQTTLIAFNNPDDALALSDYIGVIDRGRLLQFGETWEIYHQPATFTVMEMTSNLGVNALPVTVRDGKTAPYNFPVDKADGEYTFAFRPEEIELSPDGIQVDIETAQFLNNKKKIAFGHIRGNEQQKISLMLPLEIEGQVAFLPLKPHLFPADTQ